MEDVDSNNESSAPAKRKFDSLGTEDEKTECFPSEKSLNSQLSSYRNGENCNHSYALKEEPRGIGSIKPLPEEEDDEEEEDADYLEEEDEGEQRKKEGGVIDRKGKGILIEDEGDENNSSEEEEEEDDDDDDESEVDGRDEDSEAEDDPLAEVDLDNILPSRTRSRTASACTRIVIGRNQDSCDNSDT